MTNICHSLTHRSQHGSSTSTKSMTTIKFTQTQSNNLAFPIGCPVWHFLKPSTTHDGSGYPILQGTVDEISMDLNRMTYEYHVVHDGKIVGGRGLNEHELAYAFQCPVVVVEEGREVEGRVLQAKNTENGVLYTVMYTLGGGFTMYKEGIGAGRVRYRHEKESKEIQTEENGLGQKDDERKMMTNSNHDHDKKPPVAEVMYDKSGASDNQHSSKHRSRTNTDATEDESVESGEMSESPNANSASSQVARGYTVNEPKLSMNDKTSNVNKLASAAPSNNVSDKRIIQKQSDVPTKKAKSAEESKKCEYSYPSFEVTLPLWLQIDKEPRDMLYAHLNTVKEKVRHEAKCNMRIQKSTTHPLTIIIIHLQPHNANREFAIARQIITDRLLEFKLPNLIPIGKDGSKARLLYEFTQSCPGGQNIKKSTSRAVTVKLDQKSQCISLVELTSAYNSTGKKVFHGQYLREKTFVDKIHKLTGCSLEFYGDEFNRPVRYCDPYVLVLGSSAAWRSVDRAVEMVREEIEGHRSGCTCFFAK